MMTLSKSKSILTVFCLLYPLFSSGQKTSRFDDLTINLKYHYGFVMQHSSNMAQLANQRPPSIELELSKQTTNKQRFAQLYNFPRIGISAHYFIMDPKKPLGNMLGIFPHMSLVIFRTARHEMHFRIGVGAGFTERRFDLHNNYKDNVISSRTSFTLSARLNYAFKTGRLNINTGLGMLHFSNGAIKVPNLGINLPSFYLGIGIRSKVQNEILPDTLQFPVFKRKNVVFMSVAGGFKQIYPIGGPDYFMGTYSLYAGRSLNRKSTILIGSDLFYDPTGKHLFDGDLSQVKKTNLKIGLNFGHELTVSRLSLITQFGYYLLDPYKVNKPFYQRYGLKYYFHPNYFAGIALKAHFGVADVVEWSAGFKF
jgi:hypothetical protein